jgi:cytochrome c-type biogenesis protein CcmE
MTPRQRNRLVLIALIVVGVGIAVSLALVALRENINLFYSPTQIAAGEAPRSHAFRVGGIVAEGSVRRATEGLKVNFDVTDGAHTVTVAYEGILPDLFREGQGIIAQGRFGADGAIVADQVLAKHDENYMPPEVADALKTAQKLGVVNPHAPGK